jgi:putative spermidine/putrescine transport system ATP-binding protein
VGDNNALAGVIGVQGGLAQADGPPLQARTASPLAAGATATLCIRPEHLRLARPADTHNRLAATVQDAIPLGDHWRLVMRLAASDTTWFAKLAPGAVPQGLGPGQPVTLSFDPDQAWLFAA